MDSLTQEEKQVFDVLMETHIPGEGLGRYKGWSLVGVEAATIIRAKYNVSLAYMGEHNFHVIGWESLSYDSDDKGDYAIRKGFSSI